MSLKRALDTLGFGPCHHMTEVLANPAQQALWRAAAQGQLPDWDEAYAGYQSAVDWPTAHYWRELSAYYPQAKVILTVRDAERWYQSISETIWHAIKPGNDPASVGVKLISEATFGGRLHDRAHALSVFRAHIEEVQASLPPERLLTYDVRDGWQPLCGFLDKPIPDIPFPRTNSTDEFKANFLQR